MGLLITYMFAAIAISALCSLLESVLLSTPQTFIATLNDKLIDKISGKKDSAVAAILIVNTIANTIGSKVNYTEINIKVHVPLNAVPGTKSWKMRLTGYYV